MYGLLPHVKITDLLLEVNRWTGFTRSFVHLKTGEPAKDQTLLLTAILADATNMGLAKMAESCLARPVLKLLQIAGGLPPGVRAVATGHLQWFVRGRPAPYNWKLLEDMPVPETTSAEALDRYVVGKKIAASKGPAWRDV